MARRGVSWLKPFCACAAIVALLLLGFRPSSTSPPPSKCLDSVAKVQQARIDALEDELRKVYASLPVPTQTSPRTSVPPSTPVVVPTRSPPKPTSFPRESDDVPWLMIAIPTVPRKGPDRLSGTLAALRDELDSQVDGRVTVVVVNNRPGLHKSFDQQRELFANNAAFEFVVNDHSEPEPPNIPFAPEFADRNQQAPTEAVLRQTLDVVSLLGLVSNRSKYLLLLEDDFALCPTALLAIRHMIEKATRYSGADGWSAIRCSFGLAGIILQNGRHTQSDADAFMRYLRQHARRRPPDHLAVEFYAKESSQSKEHFGRRTVFAFRYNIARHDGKISTLRDEEAWATPQCFEELTSPQVFEVEAWNARDCPKDDIWPCPEGRVKPMHVKWFP